MMLYRSHSLSQDPPRITPHQTRRESFRSPVHGERTCNSHSPPCVQQQSASHVVREDLSSSGKDNARSNSRPISHHHRDWRTILESIRACGRQMNLVEGSKIHADIIEEGLLLKDVYIGNALISMYCKCGALLKAREVFDQLPQRNVISWNALISGYAQQGLGNEAIDFFRKMQKEDVLPNAVTFTCMLKASGNVKSIENGEEIHKEASKKGLLNGNFVLCTALVDMYAKCGALGKAREVFDELPVVTVATWNALIAGYANHGLGDEALNCFECMQKDGFSPDEITFACILKACGSIGSVEIGEKIHSEIRKRGFLEKSIVLNNALVNMYAKCSAITKARELFDQLPVRNIVTWNALIAGYTQHGFSDESLDCYYQMQKEGFSPVAETFACILKVCGNIGSAVKGEEIHAEVSRQGLLSKNVVLGTALVDMYAKCGMLEKARQVFDKLLMRDVVAWNALIAAYSKHELADEALDCFTQMLDEGFSPDSITYACTLKACGSIGSVERGEEIHDQVRERGLLEENIMLHTALVDMYAKCGLLAKAQQLFNEFHMQDVISWNVLLSGYAQSGQLRTVLLVLTKMLITGVMPNAVTFLILLTACSHAGLVENGQVYFDMMSDAYSLSPALQHYSCMVDLFGRAGHFDRAMNLIEKVPDLDRLPLWMALLGACRNWANVEVGKFAFEHSVKLDEAHDAAYVCMGNTYAAAGMAEEASKIGTLKIRRGSKVH